MPQWCMVDILGAEVSDEERVILQHPNVGAVILFTRNFINPQQLTHLIASIRTMRPDIFIAVDHEGGVVQRFQRHGFRCLPAARVYGDVFDLNPEAGLQLARQYGEIMAHDLLAYGIDLSLAPVLDVHAKSAVIGGLDRAFHHQPEVVVQLAAAFIRGMQQAGMPAVGKHYPGHGSIAADSHTALPICHASEAELFAHDVKPFVELINQHALDGVMPAHVVYTAIDTTWPAGFSSRWLDEILRNRLGFTGLVLSDCLGMVGADIGDMPTRAHQALRAGCDLLIVCNQDRSVLHALLDQAAIQQRPESLSRIDAFKRRMRRFATESTADDFPPSRVNQTMFYAVDSGENSMMNFSGLNNTRSV